MNMIIGIYRSLVAEVKEINTKYGKPNIQMTPFVKFNLLFLRLYLMLLVGLLIYRFVVAVKQ
jgi:hypothetical protein